MSYAPPEENTLGVIFGRGRREADATRRVIRAATPRRSSLGTGFIGIGAGVVVALRSIYGFAVFLGLVSANTYPAVTPALVAWTVLLVTLIAAFMTARVIGDHLPDWAFALFLVGLGVTVSLDLIAVWPLHDIGRFATAATTAGFALTGAITLRRTADILIATGALGVILAVAMIVNTTPSVDTIAAQLSALAFTIVPPIIGVAIITGFRRLVQIELDRVLVQSTVSAPRFAVGMMASEELARLDLAAEELLDSVSTGKTKLPLDPKTASLAASLATELRLHLIEGRRETWLYHAIAESDLLGKSVTLTDRGSLAGLLDPHQRDGLLLMAWLLVSDVRKRGPGRTVDLVVGAATASGDSAHGHKVTIPIVVTTTGVARNRVDPAIWEAIGMVGQYSDSTHNASLRVAIHCLVDNPADQ